MVELFADYVVEGLEQTLTRVSEEYKTSAALQTRNIKTDLLLSHALSLCTFQQLCSVGDDNAQRGHSDTGQRVCECHHSEAILVHFVHYHKYHYYIPYH